MAKTKRFFYLLTIVFLSLLFYASYDIARRTTFPGGKAQLKERIQKKYSAEDSLRRDSLSTKFHQP